MREAILEVSNRYADAEDRGDTAAQEEAQLILNDLGGSLLASVSNIGEAQFIEQAVGFHSPVSTPELTCLSGIVGKLLVNPYPCR